MKELSYEERKEIINYANEMCKLLDNAGKYTVEEAHEVGQVIGFLAYSLDEKDDDLINVYKVLRKLTNKVIRHHIATTERLMCSIALSIYDDETFIKEIGEQI